MILGRIRIPSRTTIRSAESYVQSPEGIRKRQFLDENDRLYLRIVCDYLIVTEALVVQVIQLVDDLIRHDYVEGRSSGPLTMDAAVVQLGRALLTVPLGCPFVAGCSPVPK